VNLFGADAEFSLAQAAELLAVLIAGAGCGTGLLAASCPAGAVAWRAVS
jgi:hypothetical protein